MPRQETIIDFPEIFHFAEKEFGIHWNAANDIFFRSEVLKCRGITNVTLGGHEIPEVIYYDEIYKDFPGNDELTEYIMVNYYRSFTKEQILEMKDCDKADVIIQLFLDKHKIKEAMILGD